MGPSPRYPVYKAYTFRAYEALRSAKVIYERHERDPTEVSIENRTKLDAHRHNTARLPESQAKSDRMERVRVDREQAFRQEDRRRTRNNGGSEGRSYTDALDYHFSLEGDFHRTNDKRIPQPNYRPYRRLLRSAVVEVMDPALLATTAATTVVAPSVQEPLPLSGIITPPNTLVARELTVTVEIVDVYRHPLEAPGATLVNEVTGKRKSDLPCHHVEVRSSIACLLKTSGVNEMRGGRV